MKAMQMHEVWVVTWGHLADLKGLCHSDIWLRSCWGLSYHSWGLYQCPWPGVPWYTTAHCSHRSACDPGLSHVLDHELKYKGLSELAPPLIGPGRADPVPRRPWDYGPQLPWHDKAGRVAAPPPTLTPHLEKLFLPLTIGLGDRRI